MRRRVTAADLYEKKYTGKISGREKETRRQETRAEREELSARMFRPVIGRGRAM